VELFTRKLAVSIDHAMDVSFGGSTKGQYVYKVSVVRGYAFYGFNPILRPFFKVFIYDPGLVSRMVSLLRSGAIMSTHFEIYEAHIPFLMQLFVDFNLNGMSYIHLSRMRFRLPIPPRPKAHISIDYEDDRSFGFGKMWFRENTPISMQASDVPRLSTCNLEIDADTTDILNVIASPSSQNSYQDERSILSLASVSHIISTLLFIYLLL
jgi:DNA polymerase zeta